MIMHLSNNCYALFLITLPTTHMYKGKPNETTYMSSVAYAGKNFGGGVQGYGRPRRGSGGWAPGCRKIFENLQKNFLRKLQKMHYFSKFFKRFNKPCVNFSRVWTKNTNCWEILRNFRIFLKNFIRKFR